MNQHRIERGLRKLTQALGALAISVLASASLCAQTHKVAKPENVVRAVGVYEWTGDMGKPAASRLIPVSLFIEGKLEDAAVYQARPVPFALLTGNVYELDKAGNAIGTLDLVFARHLVQSSASATTYDDGWFGYGKVVPPSVAKNKSNLKPSKTLSAIVADEDDSKPHFSSKSATPGSGGSASPNPGTASSTDPPADDPDRPTMRRHSDASDKTASSGSSSPADTPSDDPDRPTLKRHSSEDAKQSKSDKPSVTSVPDSLNEDPNRPLLHRGKPVGSLTEGDIPKLSGLPGDQDLHQVVAVSDAADHPAHDFSRAWDDEAEHQAILGKMQLAARAQLAAYEAANAFAPVAVPPPATRRSNGRIRPSFAKETPAAPPEALLDEDVKGYTLSYGGAATYVYFAHTDGLGQSLRYVTLVAQVNMQSEPQIALKNVTDAAHLDRTPRMRLVDAVDADASNRASLLFELRAKNSRQFALYRVLGARADQTFLTGSTQ